MWCSEMPGAISCVAVVELHPLGVHRHHHFGDVASRERVAVLALEHVAAGREVHLPILQVEPRVGELIEAADVVVVQVGEHHCRRGRGIDTDQREAFGCSSQQAPIAATRRRVC